MNNSTSNIIIYKAKDGLLDVQVKFDNETVWLSLNQISDLFEKDKSVISRHIKNIFKEGELERDSVVAKSATTASDGKTYQVEFFNLDVIISVGYRVNSKKGTQFRIWATNRLKEHLLKGYTINEKRLKQLQQTIQLVKRTSQQISSTDEAEGLMEVLSEYSRALDILDDYDHQKLSKEVTESAITFRIDYNEAIKAIEQLRVKFGGSSLFGNEKDQSFKSSIAVIDQTFDGKDLYPSIEEKAANLLYLVVKNHSFTDGNKRIAAWLFVWYLSKNRFLRNEDNSKKISNNTLVALTLMIAESNPAEKEMMIKVVINLMNSKEKN
ncbi:MAG TPA: cytochrome C biogenesis protein CycH [Aequorivita sp.]|nr:cytochrome C biogenesis protein CycH [Aequorivita sp.]MBF31305.1 cytochrome C biogenesis protein CycH [Aequorivita sp.]HAV55422.1 cytochrome C biogenesis protein CycH [Aequorivita sp.]HBL78973.1 cytochrome C biogenesis protein CycH [Aequorivita sp.]